MGGGLAAEVAGRYPQLVKAAVLLDPVNYALQSTNVPNTGVSRCTNFTEFNLKTGQVAPNLKYQDAN